jgi:hypothetical protein
MTTVPRESWERMGQDRALADALSPQPGSPEHWTINDLARFFADGAQIAERQAAKELDSLRSQLADMERERDVSRGNAQMRMEAARGLAVQLEAAQADAERYRWLRANPTFLGWEHDFRADEVDAAIDAAIHKARGTK